MSAEGQLYAALTAFAGLTARVGTRIYPDAIPEGDDLPAVVFVRASTDATYTIGSVLICEDVHFMLSVWSATRTECEAVGDQIEAALHAAGRQISGRSNGFDGDVGLYSTTIETVWFYQ